MNKLNNKAMILMADDDPDDQILLQEALKENNIPNSVCFVENGEELLDFLHKRGKFEGVEFSPGLILLDLNMPKMDGRQALKLLKADPLLKKIPIVVLTTSRADSDILECYDLGVNSFISKPVNFAELVDVTREISNYWLGTVTLPESK
ncbi:response regulator [Algoriphagus terrigena]|uniref:response regulator n=1 Tax=Algoriphagus terrigena TaxID=344884 RepID=UPI00047EB6CB|nr:response regulator [Algoriphagus terrigena]